jgi:hypothetical protein
VADFVVIGGATLGATAAPHRAEAGAGVGRPRQEHAREPATRFGIGIELP